MPLPACFTPKHLFGIAEDNDYDVLEPVQDGRRRKPVIVKGKTKSKKSGTAQTVGVRCSVTQDGRAEVCMTIEGKRKYITTFTERKHGKQFGALGCALRDQISQKKLSADAAKDVAKTFIETYGAQCG